MKKLLFFIIVVLMSHFVYGQWTVTDYYGIDSLGYGSGWRYYNHKLDYQFRTGLTSGNSMIKYEKFLSSKTIFNDEVIVRCKVSGGSVHAMVELYNDLNPSVATNVVTLSATGNSENFNFLLPAGTISFNRIRILFGYFPYEYGVRTISVDSIYTKNGVTIENPYWYSPTGIKEKKEVNPSEFSLGQNYPNPFNPETSIEFNLPSNEFVNVVVYNQIGQEVAVLADGEMSAGTHKVKLNAENLPSGIYFCQAKTGNIKKIIKMVLLK